MPDAQGRALSLVEWERLHIEEALERHNHNHTHTARELGIARTTLLTKIQKYRAAAELDDGKPRCHNCGWIIEEGSPGA